MKDQDRDPANYNSKITFKFPLTTAVHIFYFLQLSYHK